MYEEWMSSVLSPADPVSGGQTEPLLLCDSCKETELVESTESSRSQARQQQDDAVRRPARRCAQGAKRNATGDLSETSLGAERAAIGLWDSAGEGAAREVQKGQLDKDNDTRAERIGPAEGVLATDRPAGHVQVEGAETVVGTGTTEAIDTAAVMTDGQSDKIEEADSDCTRGYSCTPPGESAGCGFSSSEDSGTETVAEKGEANIGAGTAAAAGGGDKEGRGNTGGGRCEPGYGFSSSDEGDGDGEMTEARVREMYRVGVDAIWPYVMVGKILELGRARMSAAQVAGRNERFDIALIGQLLQEKRREMRVGDDAGSAAGSATARCSETGLHGQGQSEGQREAETGRATEQCSAGRGTEREPQDWKND